jgi:hypothetical protein
LSDEDGILSNDRWLVAVGVLSFGSGWFGLVRTSKAQKFGWLVGSQRCEGGMV